MATVLDLGNIAMTGIFPARGESQPQYGPLKLVRCYSDEGSSCGLIQLHQQYDPLLMYGTHYSYRSGITSTMRAHLSSNVDYVKSKVDIYPGDAVLDIGSNDATLLKSYERSDISLFGIDPSAKQFESLYPSNSSLITDFFPSTELDQLAPKSGFKVITSIAMFYDLHDPVAFMKSIARLLSPDGLWYTEQSYVGALLDDLCYDSVCHEHFCYYGLRQMVWMAEQAGLQVIDVNFNDVNGGSFAVAFQLKSSNTLTVSTRVQHVIDREVQMENEWTFKANSIQTRVDQHIETVKRFFTEAQNQNKRIYGYGASTKGNVILQAAGITPEMMPAIAERDSRKFNRKTPGTSIPIVSEETVRHLNPDYLFVLPWHFKREILHREQGFLSKGGQIVFPLPRFEIHRFNGFSTLTG